MWARIRFLFAGPANGAVCIVPNRVDREPENPETRGDQFVNRRIRTFRMRPKAASVAMSDDPP